MKRITKQMAAGLTALLLLLSLTACGGEEKPGAPVGDISAPSASQGGGSISSVPEVTPEPEGPVALARPGATLAAGYNVTVGLLPDGSGVAAGKVPGYCDVQYSTAVAGSRNGVIGLHLSGVPMIFGGDGIGIQDTIDWRVVAVATGYSHIVGLNPDGTVIATGLNRNGQCNVEDWTDIVAVAAGNHQTAGIRSDGTVVMTGASADGQCEVGDWTDITAVAVGNAHTVGLKSDGTVVAVGNNVYGQCDVGGWTDILAVAAGGAHTLGLRSDGTVIAIGDNEYGQCDVDGWTDIVAIAASYGHSVGLRSNGTVVAAGWNEYGQCDVKGWVLRVPEQ